MTQIYLSANVRYVAGKHLAFWWRQGADEGFCRPSKPHPSSLFIGQAAAPVTNSGFMPPADNGYLISGHSAAATWLNASPGPELRLSRRKTYSCPWTRDVCVRDRNFAWQMNVLVVHGTEPTFFVTRPSGTFCLQSLMWPPTRACLPSPPRIAPLFNVKIAKKLSGNVWDTSGKLSDVAYIWEITSSQQKTYFNLDLEIYLFSCNSKMMFLSISLSLLAALILTNFSFRWLLALINFGYYFWLLALIKFDILFCCVPGILLLTTSDFSSSKSPRMFHLISLLVIVFFSL